MSEVADAFDAPSFIERIKKQLPKLFREAREEAKEINNTFIVGNFRKQKLKTLLIEHFGKENIEFFSSSILPGVDMKIHSHPVSIKTITENNALKVIWGSDRKKMIEKMEEYSPPSNIILARINWEMKERYQPCGLFWIPIKAQLNLIKSMGIDNYFRPPKEGTNSRGVPLSKLAFRALLKDTNTKRIEVNWRK